ncbi:outer membrane protein transport protein [Sulfurovum sp. zt1-1]|uniref:Outer membrane protein transport protein n=1 Tax=Sulfurovum zhangzhouensis TaxID=3019067 RepID=A0ABT7QY56_9BACT|nr:outer membrane protein transport protein [Sulfurovum zhangzhouensis]MDM5271765.1 outer membrane protein transport protein [Sulfurovum zhangzhouensis]
MKRKGKLLVRAGIALSMITVTTLHATNGDTLISVGAKARGMGGAGIAVSHCAESTLQNPALITCTEGTFISFGGTVFMPDISANMGMAAEHESDADMNVIPSVSISHKFNDNWYLGIGMWGTAGMGVDYRDAPQIPGMDSGNMHMVSNLQLMQFGISAAYKTNGLSLAVTPILQYGSLDINYNGFDGSSIGDGVAQDLNFGINFGAAYDFSNGLTLGAVYKSKIDMDYSNQLSNATQPFVDLGIFPGAMENHLEQPAEIGFGVGYKIENHTFAVDYKKIQWSDAKGYKDFGWADQNVMSYGYQYNRDNWAVRIGYNHAAHPIDEMPSAPTSVVTPANYPYAAGNAINLFNLLGFPATAKTHITVGGTYEFTDTFSLDLAYVHAPQTTTTMNTIVGYSDNGTPVNPDDDALYIGESSVKHMEDSLSFQLNYQF